MPKRRSSPSFPEKRPSPRAHLHHLRRSGCSGLLYFRHFAWPTSINEGKAKDTIIQALHSVFCKEHVRAGRENRGVGYFDSRINSSTSRSRSLPKKISLPT